MVAHPDPSPALHRHVEPTRRRQLWWWALAGTAAANAALTIAVAARPSSGGFAIAVTVHEAPPPAPAPAPPVNAPAPAAPVPIPSSGPAAPAAPARTAVAPFADRGPCPAPGAGATGRFVQPPEPYLVGVAPSPSDGRWIAAWTREHVYVSRDGGRSWARVLDGDGVVLDATFDCHGRVFALRHRAGLGVHDEGRETWRTIASVATYQPARGDADGDGEVDVAVEELPPEPGDGYLAQLVGGGRAIVVVGLGNGGSDTQQRAVISADAGASWRQVDLGWYEGPRRLSVAWSGDDLNIVRPWTDCMSEGIDLVTVSPTGIRTTAIDEYAADVALAGSILLAPAGSYLCEDDAGDALCVWRGGRWTVRPGPPAVDGDGEDDGEDDRVPRLIEGPVDVMLVDERVYRVSARGFGPSRAWDARWTPVATDRAGRLWGLDELGQLVRS